MEKGIENRDRTGWFGRLYKRDARNQGSLILLMVCILLTAFLFGGIRVQTAAKEESASTTIHLLDVGQGLSVLIQSEGENLLYDGGGRDASSYVVSYLKNHEAENLDTVVVSHYDEDHLSGIVGCLHALTVRKVIGPDYEKESEIYTSFTEAVRQAGLTVEHPEVGTVFEIGSCRVTVLSPASTAEEDNNNCVTLMVEDGGEKILLMGDAETEEEADILSAGFDLDCDLLIAGHHGSAGSTGSAFLEKALPEYVFISCGRDNLYGHPHEETLERLEAAGVQMFRSDLQGTIIADIRGGELAFDQDPCLDHTSGQKIAADGEYTRSAENLVGGKMEEPENQTVEAADYVLNTNTGKFHIPSCGSVKQMKEKNKQFYTGTRDELISQGYDPCGNCKP